MGLDGYLYQVPWLASTPRDPKHCSVEFRIAICPSSLHLDWFNKMNKPPPFLIIWLPIHLFVVFSWIDSLNVSPAIAQLNWFTELDISTPNYQANDLIKSVSSTHERSPSSYLDILYSYEITVAFVSKSSIRTAPSRSPACVYPADSVLQSNHHCRVFRCLD